MPSVVDPARGAPHSGGMGRPLVALTLAALLALLLGLGRSPHPVAAVALALLFTALATVGFARVQQRGAAARAGYFAVQLPLGFAVFGLAGATTGAGLLLVLLVSQAVLVLHPGWALLVAALTPLVHLGMTTPDAVREGTGMLVAASFAYVFTLLHVREQRARAELAAANDQLRRAAEQAEELATARERNRLARDIHDGLGHHLTVVQMQLQAAGTVLAHDPQKAGELLEKAQHQTREALADVRRSVSALRETPDGPALPDVLAGLARDSCDGGVATTVDVLGASRPLPPQTADSLFRSAQEGLTNVRKHAGAEQAVVVLDYTRPDVVRLEVRDDGRGVGDGAGSGFGLRGLSERVRMLGGTVAVEPGDGRGLTLRVELPG
jgi:signal transduction histidine kinase